MAVVGEDHRQLRFSNCGCVFATAARVKAMIVNPLESDVLQENNKHLLSYYTKHPGHFSGLRGQLSSEM